MNAPPVGSRVELTHDVERYPHFVAAAGSTGTVVDIGDPNIYAVRLDEPLAGAEEWSNEVHWILDTGDDPSGAVRSLATAADFVNLDALYAANIRELQNIVAAGGPTALIEAAGAELERRGYAVEEADEQERAYELASADVVLALTRDEADLLAGVLAEHVEDRHDRDHASDEDRAAWLEHAAEVDRLLERLEVRS